MSLKELIRMQSFGALSIEEPSTPRPGGVPQGTVLVVLDVTKETSTEAVYWALGNVVRRGDTFRILGLITHMNNPMGFWARVDKDSWLGPNRILLEHALTSKRKKLDSIPHVKEWCEKAGVNLELDVKAGYVTKTIIVDEAKAVSAFHVVLEKTLNRDRKYFIENLTCFVSRARNSGGIETIRSFSVRKDWSPPVPTVSNSRFNGTIQPTPSVGSVTSMASVNSCRGSASSRSFHGSASSRSFEAVCSDGFLTLDSDAFTGPTNTADSFDHDEIQSSPSASASRSNSDVSRQALPELLHPCYKIISKSKQE